MKRKIFSILLILCMMFTLFPAGVFAADPTYNTGDIAIINAIINNNHPDGMTPANPDGSESPADWKDKVTWSGNAGDTNRRVIRLCLNGKSMTGTLNVSGLTALKELQCTYNQLTGLTLGSLPDLATMFIFGNKLSGSLDLSGFSALEYLDCSNNQLTGLTLNDTAPYQFINVCKNYMADTNAITGRSGINWDTDPNFNFSPQHRIITYDVNGGDLGGLPNGVATDGVPFTLPSDTSAFTPPGGKQFKAWAIGSADGTQVDAGGTYTFTADTTVYAVWENIPPYNRGDIAIINAIIAAHPGKTGMTPANPDGSESPASWNGRVTWSGNAGDTNRRVIILNLNSKSMSGTLDVSGLTALTELQCVTNQLTGLNLSSLPSLVTLLCGNNQLASLNISGLTALEVLYCNNNQLASLNLSGPVALKQLNCADNQLSGTLDLSGLSALERLHCYKNQLTSLNLGGLSALEILLCYENQLTGIKLNSAAPYQGIDARYNFMANTGAITNGPSIDWDTAPYKFKFSPQYRRITYNANGGGGEMKPGKATDGEEFELPVCGFMAPPKKQFWIWAIGGTGGEKKAPGEKYIFTADTEVFALWDDIHVTGVTLNKNTLAIGLGDSETLIATVSPDDAANKAVDWKSDDPAIASVDENGKVTAHALGTTTITATSKDIDDFFDTCEVTVVKKQTMKFSPSGGKWKDGSTDPIIISAIAGAEITIPEGPVRAGYKFQYWKGSKYKPGDKFKVPEGGHEFTAVWAKAATSWFAPSPKTGDNMGICLWSSLALFSAGGLLLLRRRKKQRQKD
ncbi:MAG: LPXTG cell wall anchor domain-containing protein [Clostridiales bacterium]|nr:LPXTG cell wall anchor domain-containing protein [Clostridiales bacterium]